MVCERRLADVTLEYLTFINCSRSPYLLYVNGLPQRPVDGVRVRYPLYASQLFLT